MDCEDSIAAFNASTVALAKVSDGRSMGNVPPLRVFTKKRIEEDEVEVEVEVDEEEEEEEDEEDSIGVKRDGGMNGAQHQGGGLKDDHRIGEYEIR